MITEDYVSFEIAELLKEKGFDWVCISYYVNHEPNDVKYSFLGEDNTTWEQRCCSAPTLQMVMKWLREVHKIDVCVCRELDDYCGCYNGYIAVVYSNEVYMDTIRDVVKDLSYEEVAELAIKYCLTNLI